MLQFFSILCFYLFVCSTAFAQNISRAQIDSLVTRARETNSDGLVLVQDNKVILEEYFNNPKTPTYIASVSKALVSIGITKLLSDGKIKSIDQPVSDFYPEWKQGQKRLITIRMLLSHTSGLQNEKNSRLEIETGPKGSGDDLVKLALAAEITDKPGTVYNYNNKATCLLPGIIEEASGIRMDRFFEETFFKPMGITQFGWKRDGTGRPQGHGGFELLPADLAKFGQLMLDKGVYNGKRYFESRWADSAVAASQGINTDIGLIWHRFAPSRITIWIDESHLEKLKTSGVHDSVIAGLRPLLNIKMHDEYELVGKLQKQFGENWLKTLEDAARSLPGGKKDLFKTTSVKGEIKGYYHTGSWGNYLVVVPELKLVAVRLVKRDKAYKETDLFGEFVSRIFRL